MLLLRVAGATAASTAQGPVVILLIAATAATFLGCSFIAIWVEPSSPSRRILAFSLLVPAQITVLVLVTGTARVLRPGPLALSAGLVSALETWIWVRTVRSTHPPTIRPALGRAFRRSWRHPLLAAISALVGAAFAWEVAGAVRLPVVSWDSLYYHLPGPTAWVQLGRITDSHVNIYSDGYPQGQEVLHAWTMVFLHSTRGTGIVVAWWALVGAAAVACLTRRIASRSAAVLAALVWLATPVVATQIGGAYVDVSGAAAILASCVFLLDWAKRSREVLPFRGLAARSFVMASIAGGLAIGTKASSAVALVSAGGFVVWVLWERSGEVDVPLLDWRVDRRVFGLATLGMMLGGVWYLRNLYLHQNPLWPVTTLGFPGVGTYQQLVVSNQTPYDLRGLNPLSQVARSWGATLHVPMYTYDIRVGGLGPIWLLAGLPALVWLGVRSVRRDRAAFLYLLATALTVGLATRMAWWARYTLVLAGLGCIAIGGAVDALRQAGGPRLVRRLAPVLAQLGVLVCLALTTREIVLKPNLTVSVPVPRAASPSDIVRLIRSGDGQRTMWPWAGYAGLSELPPGAPVGFLDTMSGQLPALMAGEDLSHRFVAVARPDTVADLPTVMRRAGVSFLYLPDGLPPDSVEMTAIRESPTRFQEYDLPQPPGASIYQLGRFRACGPATISVIWVPRGRTTLIGGIVKDACGTVGKAPIELWMSGPDPNRLWDGAARLDTGRADGGGGFRLRQPRSSLDPSRAYFIRQPAFGSHQEVHEAGASNIYRPSR